MKSNKVKQVLYSCQELFSKLDPLIQKWLIIQMVFLRRFCHIVLGGKNPAEQNDMM